MQGDGAGTQRRCTTPRQSDLVALSIRSCWGVEESGLHPHRHGRNLRQPALSPSLLVQNTGPWVKPTRFRETLLSPWAQG